MVVACEDEEGGAPRAAPGAAGGGGGQPALGRWRECGVLRCDNSDPLTSLPTGRPPAEDLDVPLVSIKFR